MHGKELVIKLFHLIVQNKIKTPAKIEHYCLANAPSTSVRERIGFTVKLLVSLPQGGGGGGGGEYSIQVCYWESFICLYSNTMCDPEPIISILGGMWGHSQFVFKYYFALKVGRFPSLLYIHYYTMILQHIKNIIGDAGFDPGTTATEVVFFSPATSDTPPPCARVICHPPRIPVTIVGHNLR